VLCEEAGANGRGKLVLIELKRQPGEGTIEQVVRYLNDLALEPLAATGPGVRAIVITGSDDFTDARLASNMNGLDINWFRFEVSLVASHRVQSGRHPERLAHAASPATCPDRQGAIAPLSADAAMNSWQRGSSRAYPGLGCLFSRRHHASS